MFIEDDSGDWLEYRSRELINQCDKADLCKVESQIVFE